MDLSKLSFEEFSAKLAARSNRELKKMATGYDITLPDGLDSKDAILRAMYEAITSSAPPPAKVEPDASSSSAPDAGGGPRIRILSTTGGRQYWRCGFKFTPNWQEFPVSAFTPSQLETLRADPNLRIKEI